MKRRSCWQLVLFLLQAGFSDVASAESVRKADFSEVPEMKELAEHARRIGNQIYPKLLTLLTDGTSKSPRRFDIVFKKHVADADVALTRDTTIYLSDRRIGLNSTIPNIAAKC